MLFKLLCMFYCLLWNLEPFVADEPWKVFIVVMSVILLDFPAIIGIAWLVGLVALMRKYKGVM